LLEKKYPLEIAEKYSQEFKLITNGIPLFVSMIPNWTGRELNCEPEKLIGIILVELHNKVEKHQIEKIMKFKLEYYDKFDIEFENGKEKFKEVLLALEDNNYSLNIELYDKFVDYQLMDFEYSEENLEKMKIKTDFPDVLRLYKKYLNLKLRNKEELKINVNMMKSYIYEDDPQQYDLAGKAFEKALISAFSLRNTYDEKLEPDQIFMKMENFNVYNSLFFRESLEINAFSRAEMNSPILLNEESLPLNHFLKNKKLNPKIFFSEISLNMLFQNEFPMVPIIDGGFIFKEDPYGRNHFKIITYDATVGDKKWSDLNIELDDKLLENLEKRFPSKVKNQETDALKRVIIKLEQCLPRTFYAFLKFLGVSFEFDKHIIIFPDLNGIL